MPASSFRTVQQASSTNNGSYGAVVVGDTPTQIVPDKKTRAGCLIQNSSAVSDVYVGMDDQVSISSGIKITPGASLSDIQWTGAIYGIVAAGTAIVRAWDVG